MSELKVGSTIYYRTDHQAFFKGTLLRIYEDSFPAGTHEVTVQLFDIQLDTGIKCIGLSRDEIYLQDEYLLANIQGVFERIRSKIRTSKSQEDDIDSKYIEKNSAKSAKYYLDQYLSRINSRTFCNTPTEKDELIDILVSSAAGIMEEINSIRLEQLQE